MTDELPGQAEPDEAEPITVRIDSTTHRVQPGVEFTFGRAAGCTVCLDETDLAVSRLAGRVERDSGLWWVVNASASRSLGIVDEYGLRSVLPPGRRRAAEGPIRVLVDGQERSYELFVEVSPPADVPGVDDGTPAAGQPTTIGEEVVVNPADRAALIALFAGYLEEGTRYDPNPKSYAAAAARLGWPRTTLVKRIEYLRARLSNAGVPNLTGPFALNNLAEYALTTGLVTREDLPLLRGQG
ncbi:hypothetical protein SAMN05443575_2908 [Jatrophihabitans endophyticus]|uniref:FHA domain-containing protein n=1 Tax=Jatrophihabitans endophyticus TaxID=1206085 RepID=A0A1M5N457_9ACTN|nr:hypothetical protein [Jatrophihabitans endophyticus]SHG84235.1 hypothetical protein SAMN05443575_2908 [Jatrophihabitans endophyticus]